MFGLQDAIYLIELAFYCPIVPAIIFIILIHGGRKPHTWRPIIIPLLLLSGLRIAGAALGLTAMNPDKSSLLTSATLLDTLGLAPVLCLLVGLLIRANAPLYHGIRLWAFLPLQLVIVGATVMTAYGGRDLYSKSSHQNITQDLTLMKTGICIFITAFSTTSVLAVITMLKVRDKCYRTERAAAVCALLSVPFISVRLAFSAGSLFSGQHSVLTFMVGDNDTAIWLHLFMVIVMEYVLTLASTAVALTSRRVAVVVAAKDDLLSSETLS